MDGQLGEIVAGAGQHLCDIPPVLSVPRIRRGDSPRRGGRAGLTQRLLCQAGATGPPCTYVRLGDSVPLPVLRQEQRSASGPQWPRTRPALLFATLPAPSAGAGAIAHSARLPSRLGDDPCQRVAWHSPAETRRGEKRQGMRWQECRRGRRPAPDAPSHHLPPLPSAFPHRATPRRRA